MKGLNVKAFRELHKANLNLLSLRYWGFSGSGAAGGLGFRVRDLGFRILALCL